MYVNENKFGFAMEVLYSVAGDLYVGYVNENIFGFAMMMDFLYSVTADIHRLPLHVIL